MNHIHCIEEITRSCYLWFLVLTGEINLPVWCVTDENFTQVCICVVAVYRRMSTYDYIVRQREKEEQKARDEPSELRPAASPTYASPKSTKVGYIATDVTLRMFLFHIRGSLLIRQR